MGSIIAGQYAMGLDPNEMVELNGRITRLKPFNEYTLPFISLLRTRKIEQAAQLSFGERNIEDFWLPYFCVSTNLATAAMVVHDRGPAWLATRASGSLPGIALPVVLGNQLLVDGGVINNVPADVMRQRWNGAVVAVNVSPREDLSFNLSAFPSPTP